jgi:hypothetical protein
MDFLEGFGLVLGVALILLVTLFARRLIIARGGTVQLSVRLNSRQRGRGWAIGMGRFSGDRLVWYRLFSLSPRPRRVLNRRDLQVVGRRDPSDTERHALMHGSVVLECATRDGDLIELAMDNATLTGFLSWMEAATRGRGYPPFAA